jgi:RimJ/RimL family protein N-acetyltransferase
MKGFIAPEKIETPEFTIRAYQPEDWPVYQATMNISYEHLRTYMAWAKPEISDQEAEINCRTFRGKYLLSEDFIMGIFSPTGDKLLGGTGFHLRGRSIEDCVGEIGMWISGAEAGKGLGTKALNTMLRWGFDEWPWERIFWRCSSQNIASARTAEKAGLIKEATLRGEHILHSTRERHDMLYFGALKGEWTYNGN